MESITGTDICFLNWLPEEFINVSTTEVNEGFISLFSCDCFLLQYGYKIC